MNLSIKFTRRAKVIPLLLLMLFALIMTSACKAKPEQEASTQAEQESPAEEEALASDSAFERSEDVSNFVRIVMDSGASIVLELYPEKAPITVENFQNLVAEKFYDGLIFHRVIDGFMIQGGDPEGTGMGGAENKIKGEFASNGVENDLQHARGVLSMARSQDPNSASSQFFICQADSFFLDGDYAAFGEVREGLEEVDRIAKLAKNAQDRPDEPPVMTELYFVKPIQ